MINQEEFYTLHKLASTTKRKVLCLTNDILYGADRRFATVSMIYLDKDKYPYTLEQPICYYKTDIIDGFTLEEKYSYAIKSHWTIIDNSLINTDPSLYPNLSQCINHIFLYKYNQPIHQVDDLKTYDNFMTIHNSKAAVGGSIINIDGFPISISPGMHPLNKSDKISLVIYPINYTSFLTEYIITKKGYTIYEYFRNRYL